MKKLFALLLAMAMVFALAACGNTEPTTAPTTQPTNPAEPSVMTYEEFMAAEIDADVVVECYVQGHQAWWEDKITVYAQDENGGYYLYEMACSEEDSARLVPGTKIRVTGVKAEWAGEIEIVDATFEILEGSWIAEAQDVTALLGTEELEAKMNQLGAFKGLTVVSWEYQNETVGKDIYLTVSYNGAEYEFCVESYLTADGSEVYDLAETLVAGQIVDIEGFIYWYEGANPHITSITVVEVG